MTGSTDVAGPAADGRTMSAAWQSHNQNQKITTEARRRGDSTEKISFGKSKGNSKSKNHGVKTERAKSLAREFTAHQDRLTLNKRELK